MMIALGSFGLPQKKTNTQEESISLALQATLRENLVSYLSEKPLGLTTFILQKITRHHLPNLPYSKKSSLAKDKNPNQPLVSIHVVTEMHKEASQTTHGQMSLGTTGEVKANPQLSSVVSAFTSKLIVTISIIVHSESASRGDTSASLTAGADLVQSDPKESFPQQQGNKEGTKTLQGLALRIQRMKPNLLEKCRILVIL
ncbi:hypothetical protein Tco_0132198 [Tanacetum coccineum]